MCLWYSRWAVTDPSPWITSFTLGLKGKNKTGLGLFCINTTAEGFDSASFLTQPTDVLPFSSSHTESFCCSLLESGSNTACAFVGHGAQKSHSPAGGGQVCLKPPGRGLPLTPAAAVLDHFGKSFQESPKRRRDRSNIHVAESQEDIWNPQQKQALGYVNIHHIHLFRAEQGNLEGIFDCVLKHWSQQ